MQRWIWLVLCASLIGCGKAEEKAKEAFSEAKIETAEVQAKQLVSAYASWSMQNQDICPDSIDALLEFTNRNDANDPWGNDFELLCGDSVPADVKGRVGIRSAGPDGEPGTDDDVTSW